MRNIYDILDSIEKRPAMYLGNDYKIESLDNFVTGFIFAHGKLYDKTLNYPNFSFFTDWVGGMLKYKHDRSSGNWCWLLGQKFKEDKKVFGKFFHYLNLFKNSKSEIAIIQLKKENIQYSIDNQINHLWCGITKRYYTTLKKADKLILFKLTPSKTLFCFLFDKNNKIIGGYESDMTDQVLRKKIETQFNLNLTNIKFTNSSAGHAILRQNKFI